MLKPVPVVILLSPGLKHKLAKKDACASPATPDIGISFRKLFSKLLRPKLLELDFTSASLNCSISKIENSSLSQRLSMQLNNKVREAFVVSVTYSLHLVRR